MKYAKPVDVTSNPALGDLYAMMFVSFIGLDSGGLGADALYKFKAATDHLGPPSISGVPVPAALPLMLAGVAGLAWVGRRKG